MIYTASKPCLLFIPNTVELQCIYFSYYSEMIESIFEQLDVILKITAILLFLRWIILCTNISKNNIINSETL